MKNAVVLKTIIVVLMLGFMGGTAGNIALAGEMFVFTNKAVPDNTLSQTELKNIFLGKKVRWADNQRVDCVMLKDATCQEAFLNQHIRKTPFQFNNYWKKQIFTGKGQPPQTFDSQQALIDYVSQTSGAVGYSCTRPDTTKVNVIQIN